ncbi:MAG TPA: glycosyltransferase family 4 protein [Candidatus Binataceae bacterium]|nr:glycosyltransferase family 4 protein [Candidatus Binataceae bacterium]
MIDRRYKIAVLSTHPIQYQVPLFRRLAADPAIDLQVFFFSDHSVSGANDAGFGVRVKWDVPLLDGYRYEFLPSVGARDVLTFWRPFSYGLARRLREGAYDALWVHGYGHRGLLAAIAAARMSGMRLLLRGDSQLGDDPRNPTKLWLKRAMIPRLFQQFDGFLAIGTLNREYYLRYGVAPERIFMMPYAVDNAFFRERAEHAHRVREEFRAALGLAPERPVVLYASKLQAHKRPMDLLAAHARLLRGQGDGPHPYLLFVGDGEERAALETRAAELPGESVRLLGFRNQTELPALFDLADLFVLPSEREPWGLVLNEAMNAACPLVVSDHVGAAPDLVANGVNGFVYPCGDIAALADRISKVIENRERAEQMGRASLERVAQFDFEADADGLFAAMDTLTNNARRAAA